MPPGELDRLYDDHASALFAFLLNFTRDESDTRDILQEVFTRLASRPHILQGVVDVRGFLLRLTHNLAVDAIRRRASRRRTQDAMAQEAVSIFEPEPNPDQAIVQRQIEAALAELPPEQRAVLQLKLWEGLTFDAIADVLGIPLNTAASRYRYAMDKLRPRLRPLYDEIR
ncbi:MAG: sigma-70 family RNA polymerase sigma factor [Verrucomicrobiales bacterium]|nr:sigma-70 family RNA polymerase sigma factor [Verrucomicrobiales bacterium]